MQDNKNGPTDADAWRVEDRTWTGSAPGAQTLARLAGGAPGLQLAPRRQNVVGLGPVKIQPGARKSGD